MSQERTPLDMVSAPKAQNSVDFRLLELPKQYELLGKISEGGMGAIFKAQNRYTGAKFAIKVMRAEAAQKQNALERFKFEAKAASSLKHPHICQVHDFGLTENNMPYLVMGWIDGINLASKVNRDKALPAQEAIVIFQQVASALAHAHANKVVHRDLKPENIMLSRDPQGRTEVHLVDFGIAKELCDEEATEDPQSNALTRTGMVVGTPLFMSPEQARGLTVDGRTDVYSFGCLMYFALTGKAPYVGRTVIDTINMHLNDPLPEVDPALKVPADLKMIMYKSMEKEREDRYQTMDQIAADLKKLIKGVSIEKHVTSGEKQSQRRKIFIALYFLLGFIATYLISNALQAFLDSGATSTKSKTSAPTAKAHKSHP